MNWEQHQTEREEKSAYYKAKNHRKQPCQKCGLHGCICQITLKEFQR